jgi:hypothetical protein
MKSLVSITIKAAAVASILAAICLVVGFALVLS